MVKTGLMDELFFKANANKVAFDVDQLSPSKEAWRDSMNDILEVLKEIHRDGDFDTMLETERFMLQEELQKYANSPEQIASIENAQHQMALADKALDLVRHNHEGYKGLAQGIKARDIRKDGTPVDQFRDFLNSHKTRLNNKLAANVPVPEKNLIRVRKDIIIELEKKYKQMQREVLGLTKEKEKSKGLER